MARLRCTRSIAHRGPTERISMTAPNGPDRIRALQVYREAAAGYEQDLSIRLLAPVRRREVGWLELREGLTVLDVACGTGLNFAALRARVGEKGRIVGVELSPEMVAIARERTRAAGWENVELVQSAVEDAVLPTGADAALFSFTHDVLRSGKALERVVAAWHPGARVVGAGVMAPWM